MKLPCEIVQDLLPLYVDGVCSGESRRAVEEHLENCEACRKERQIMDMDIQSNHPQTEDQEPVKAAAIAWKQGKHKAFLKGCIITLIILSLVAAILCHCLIPIAISPKSFQSGDVFQHRVFRWNTPAFIVRLLCAKPMLENPIGDSTPEYDQLLWSYRACTVNGEKGDMGFFFKDGLTIIEILFNEKKNLEWSYQLLEEFREHYGTETRVLENNGKILYYVWELGDSCLRFSTGEFGKPSIYIYESIEAK